MEKEPLVIDNKSCKSYFLCEGVKVYFNADFDSGNLEKVEQLSPYSYRVYPGYDKTRHSTKKTFFHFKVLGLRMCTVKFMITRVHILEHLIKYDESTEFYHPVARKPNSDFQKVRSDVKLYYNSFDQPELSFSYHFENENWVEFAFTYPYGYEDVVELIGQLKQKYTDHEDIYFHEETLCKTSPDRKVHLISITEKVNLQKEREQKIDSLFLPDENRPFKIDKPKILLSARVHPGETPASYAIEGAIRFILHQTDYRAYLLRKYFHFIIIPMLNPEGVYNGMFRNDMNGDNLNRMYVNCDQKKHTSIWSVKKYISSLENVAFCFDFHAHPSRKGFFIYGNAFDQFVNQVEAQIFSKMIESNCPYFQNLDCIYSEKAMSSKDKHEHYTKEGCARVFYHRAFNIIHSYTVECGYFAPSKLNKYPNFKESALQHDQYGYNNAWEELSMKEYTPDTYRFMGKSILITILDLFHLNPYSRLSQGEFRSINCLRKFTAQKIYNQVQRFRLIDSNCYRKIKEIASIIEEDYYKPKFKKYALTISENYGMKHFKKSFSLNARVYMSSNKISISKKVQNELEGSHFLSEEKTNINRQISEENCTREEEFLQHLRGEEVVDHLGNMESSICQNFIQENQNQTTLHLQMLSSFQRYNKPSREKIFRVTKLLNSIDQPHFQSSNKATGSIQQQRKSASVSKLKKSSSSSKKIEHAIQGSSKMIENEIISQLMSMKLKKSAQKVKSTKEDMFKLNRIESFLKKQSKKKDKLPLLGEKAKCKEETLKK